MLQKRYKGCSMFLRGVHFAFFFGVLRVVICAPIKQEKVDPVDLNYYCFHMTESGNNSRKSPVLLIHGLGSTLNDWGDIYEILAVDTGRRVCGVDLRNHGDSPWNNRSDVEAMALDIKHFLDKKNIQKVNIIGHSLGGKIAVHFTLKNPERVDSLVVEDMRPNGLTFKGRMMVKVGFTLLKEGLKAVPEGSDEVTARKAIMKYIKDKLVDMGFNESFEVDPEKSLMAIRFVDGKWLYKMNMELLGRILENIDKFLTESSGLYNGPTLFIYGTKSFFDIPDDEKNIRRLFPAAVLKPVEGAGHMIHAKYRQFIDEVTKLLNKKKQA